MNESIWDYFEKCEDGDEKLAKCRFCAKLYNYQSTTHNLKSHLKHKHNDIDEIGFIDRKQNVTKTLKGKNSELWEHFTIIDFEGKTAKCNYCQKPLCYKTTITNLKSHLRRIHEKAYNALIESGDACLQNMEEEIYLEDYDESNLSTKDSVATDIWGYFEKETGGRARCSVCRERIPQRLSHLKNHMSEKHPKLMLEIYQDSENASANETEDQNDNTYTEVVYLSDGYTNSKIKQEDRDLRSSRKSLRNRREIAQMRHRIAEKKRRKHSSSSEEFQDKRRKLTDDEEIDKFGVYITCLLKKMPRDVCMKLQMDIVNLVMKANLNNVQKEEQKPESTVENKIIINGVPVTIQSVGSSPGGGYVLTVPNDVDGVKKEAVRKTTLNAVVNEEKHEEGDHEDISENVRSHTTDTTQSVNAGVITVTNVMSNFTEND